MTKNCLSSVHVGDGAVIECLSLGGDTGARLLDLGMTPGSRVKCLYAAPSGDPKAYLVRGAVIALRNEDAARIGLSPAGI